MGVGTAWDQFKDKDRVVAVSMVSGKTIKGIFEDDVVLDGQRYLVFLDPDVRQARMLVNTSQIATVWVQTAVRQ